MEVVMLIVVDSLAGYGTESMIMAIAAFIKNFCASGQFMNMFLVFAIILIIQFEISFFF